MRDLRRYLRRRKVIRLGRFIPQDVPYDEYAALVSLYDALDGNNWTDNSNWLSDTTINNWFGVTVAGGHVTRITLNSNNLTGDIGDIDWGNLTSLIYLYLNSNSISGDIANVSGLTSLTRLYCHATSVSGDIVNLGGLTSLNILYLYAASVSGDIANLGGLTSLTNLHLYTTSVSAGTIGTLVATRDCQIQNCGWSQAAVDALLADMYAERAAFTYATPSLNVGANNSVPSGVYQDATPPTTGLEYVFKLANDPDAEGFNTWTITYNGGVAP